MSAARKSPVIKILIVCLLIAAAAAGYFILRPKENGKTVYDSTPLEKAKVGDVVSLGSYEQDGDPENGAEALQWRVIEREGDKILLASVCGIDMKQYNPEFVDVTWETCALRSWLNGTFYEQTFSEDEKKLIALTHVTTSDNPRWGTDGGNDTDDHVFLFSAAEAVDIFGAEQDEPCDGRKVEVTEYAVSRGCWRSGMENCKNNCIAWWLRSPGASGKSVACVFGDGTILDGDQSCYVTQGHYAVRPVLWVDLKA